ncbi:MAG: hypothetical protein RLO50_17545 [Azospirillaceae bacterium]
MAGETVTVRVPMAFTRRGGRKVVVVPDGSDAWVPAPRVDGTLVRALARAHRWQRMLDEGRYATIGEMARVEGVSTGYVSRILRLTLIAPDIVEAILVGSQRLGPVCLAFEIDPQSPWVQQLADLSLDRQFGSQQSTSQLDRIS